MKPMYIDAPKNLACVRFYDKYYRQRFDNLPKYLQLREVLRAAIIDGHWKPNDKLPSEVEIVRQTPFSLGTVQKALGKLVDEGIVERRHGHGTFISQNLVMPLHCRFLDELSGHILPTYPTVLSRKMFQEQTSWSKILDPDGKKIAQIIRRINVGREFNVYNRFYINISRHKIFWDWPIEQLTGNNLRNLILYEYNQSISYTDNMLEIKPLIPEALEALRIENECIGLHIESTAYTERKKALYHYEIYVPPTNRRLQITDLV